MSNSITHCAEMPKVNDILARPIPEALGGLSTRLVNAMKAGGIRKVGDLTALTAGELTRIRNISTKSLNEVDLALKTIGLQLNTPTTRN